ncbi:MAG: MFS transporter [archaeon]|nr:MFS transporter [Nanoarchaeota archaeon]
MTHSEDHHYHWWRYFRGKEMNQIYISVALRSLAISLISIFVPMYLYNELGYTLAETLVFYIFYAVIFAISTPFTAKFACKYGFKHSVLLSAPMYVMYFFLLYQLDTYQIPLVLIAGLLGLGMSFFWMGMHLEFKKVSHKNHRGEEVGKREAVAILATLLGPLAGGALIKFVNFHIVFILASVLLLISALFLFASSERHVPYHFSVKSIFDKRYWRSSLFFVYRGMFAMTNGVIWPLFIFMSLSDYFTVGILGSVAAIGTSILMVFTGKLSDHKFKKRTIIKWFVPFESLSWIVRGFLTTFSGFLGVTMFHSITYGAMSSPMSAREYNHTRDNAVEYFITREIFICLGRILVLCFLLLTASFVSSFVLVGAASFLAVLF